MKNDFFGRTEQQISQLKKDPPKIDLIITVRHKCIECDYDKCATTALTLPISLSYLNDCVTKMQDLFDIHYHRTVETIMLDTPKTINNGILLDKKGK